ncbi:hypothetical protein B0H12DRAFT_423759 [Mycena haematopus]|nr:hypothetical protein B0H12DRAFT_423759 [Mycena haematopus]
MSVLIDDSDPLVQYISATGGWSRAGRAPEFDATTHASATPGDTAALVFEGTSISVYGTIAPSAGQSRLNFSIDGVDVASYEAPLMPAAVENQLFWASPLFNEAQHQLVITVDEDTSLGQVNKLNRTFFLDYFIYTTTSAAGKTMLIDDSDASVTYSPDGWQSFNNSDDCLESTKHIGAVGSWAALSFDGTGITVFGLPSQKGFQASIVIDGSPPVISQLQTQNQLFNSNGLPSAHHTINITVLEGNSLGIDYFVTNSSSPSSAADAQGQPAPLPSPSGTPQASKTPRIAAIVGGAVGGLALLLLLLVAVLMMRRRRAGRADQTAFEYPVMSNPWAGKRGSVTSMTTLTEDDERLRPKNLEKGRPASRYIYYE